MLLKRLLSAVIVATPAWVTAQTCVLQQSTVNRTAVTIQERSQISATVVPELNGQKKCMVDMRVKIGSEWHTAFGEHVWSGHTPKETACAVAVKRAEDSVLQRVAAGATVSENVLICNDRENLNTLAQTNPGTVADLAQFRPHPTHTKEFWYNGARCRWTVDTVWQHNTVNTMQGIICQLRGSKWVVVDKF
jgi:hypothetical protein